MTLVHYFREIIISVLKVVMLNEYGLLFKSSKVLAVEEFFYLIREVMKIKLRKNSNVQVLPAGAVMHSLYLFIVSY